MSRNLDDINLAYWFSNLEKHRCGYCKSETGSVSYGMTLHSLNVQDYQDLIDRGWRRSGKYCYKPLMDKTCCPQYTIRCNSQEFVISKSHKKIIKKFNKFLYDGILNKQDEPREAEYSDCNTTSEFVIREAPENSKVDRSKLVTDEDIVETHNSHIISNPDGCSKDINQQNNEVAEHVPQTTTKKGPFKVGIGADISKPPPKKAKLIRLERKKEKLLKRGMSLESLHTSQPERKSLEDFLNDVPKHRKHNLKLKLIPTSCPGSEWDLVEQIEFALYKKYQMIIHNDPPEKCTLNGFTRFLVSSPLKICLERMHRDHKYFKESAKLFAKYQMFVHNDPPDECDEEQYYYFLVSTPLKPVKFPNNVDAPGYGSFHQQYWLDDKLIAVGVIDILPKCISSVYFFYDPDYRSLTLGTYGSLRELEFTRSLYKQLPSIQYYYMGFYIHSCPKMRYKGKLVPSYLLCPETYEWFSIEKCIEKLNQTKYSRLNDDPDAVDVLCCSRSDVDDINVVYRNKLTKFCYYKRIFNEQAVFDNIGRLIGKKCIKNFLFQTVD